LYGAVKQLMCAAGIPICSSDIPLIGILRMLAMDTDCNKKAPQVPKSDKLGY